MNVNEILRRPGTSKLIRNLVASILVGGITGIIVSVFRMIIDHTMKGLTIIYPYLRQHPLGIIGYVMLSLLVCLTLGKIIKPELKNLIGSGVPQIEAVMMGATQMNWWSILWRKFVGGLLAICPGLFLGREGPCIEMGAMIGQGISQKLYRFDKDEERLLISCGIAAGLAAAFSAPLAGTLFLLEEILFEFKVKTALTALCSAITADLVTIICFGTRPCLYLPITRTLPLSLYPLLILIGIILGIAAYVYQYSILSLPKFYRNLKIVPRQYHSIVPLILVIPIGLYQPLLLGGSHNLINAVATGNLAHRALATTASFLGLAVLFLVIRFIFSMISYGSSVPGGIFMPILVLGALWGVVIAIMLVQLNLLPSANYINLVIICMTAYFGAIEKAPFTAVALLTEMVGTIEQILPMLIVTFIAYIINDWLGGRPIYTALRLQTFGK
ncbi:ClC family H(+)/Cl(-) exchange transporter [Ligilactobacillus equi]|uniref:ClC family H(+)/Cl(-) exchange transporter n=1 Tax=Ligilactobacillus equi TaxID=137357 RepID=UPI002ED4A00C